MVEITYPSGFVLCAITDDENAVDEAKGYCNLNGYTNKQVEIIRTGGLVIVRVK